MVSNGQKTLASLVNKPSSEFEDFFKGDLFLKLPSASYHLYSSNIGYVPFRTGNYFNLETDNILNYPYRDITKLLPINKETLEVMEAIGWNVRVYDIEITCSDLDVNGYGSVYQPHLFSISKKDDNTISNITWCYQLYDGNSYVDIQYGSGSTFNITPRIEVDEYNDTFLRQQARIVCYITKQGQTKLYYRPIYLEQRPLFIDYEISNIVGSTTSNYYSYDLKLKHLGTDYGYLFVCNDYGISLNYSIGSENETNIHVSNAYKYGSAWLDISLRNNYGNTTRQFNLDAYPNIHPKEMLSVHSKDDTFYNNKISVYTFNGMKSNSISNSKKNYPTENL